LESDSAAGSGTLFYLDKNKSSRVIHQDNSQSSREWVREFFTLPGNDNYPFVYFVEYTMMPRNADQAGVINLYVQPRDQWPNELAISAAPALRVVYDAAPPLPPSPAATRWTALGVEAAVDVDHILKFTPNSLSTAPGAPLLEYVKDRSYNPNTAAAVGVAAVPRALPDLAGQDISRFEWQFYIEDKGNRYAASQDWYPVGLFPANGIDLSGLVDGNYPLQVRIRDDLGNVAEAGSDAGVIITVSE
jgi:hypothetical protein